MSVRFTKTGLDPSMPTLISPEANPLIRTIRTTPSYSEGYVRVDLNFRQNRSLRGNPEITYSLDRITLTLFHRPVEDVWTESNTGMKFRRIPGGDFRMGSPSSEKDREDNEKQHTVSVGEFWLAETEVTQAQWQAVMGSNPSKFRGSDLPVEQVSWNDIQEFIRKLNRRTGKRFRLPTEAEWEYAARAGTQTASYWGNGIGRNNANCDGCGSRWDNEQTAPVGSFKPNAFGLFDILGNVYEWTCSEYKKSYDGSEQKCSVSAGKYSRRGGSWYSRPRWVRAAYRLSYDPGYRYGDFGFRLARD
jgi:formylglycine-generating enzyme required for sulfatase activity